MLGHLRPRALRNWGPHIERMCASGRRCVMTGADHGGRRQLTRAADRRRAFDRWLKLLAAKRTTSAPAAAVYSSTGADDCGEFGSFGTARIAWVS